MIKQQYLFSSNATWQARRHELVKCKSPPSVLRCPSIVLSSTLQAPPDYKWAAIPCLFSRLSYHFGCFLTNCIYRLSTKRWLSLFCNWVVCGRLKDGHLFASGTVSSSDRKHSNMRACPKQIHRFLLKRLCLPAFLIPNWQPQAGLHTFMARNQAIGSCEWSDIVTSTYMALYHFGFSQGIIPSNKSCLEDNPFPHLLDRHFL